MGSKSKRKKRKGVPTVPRPSSSNLLPSKTSQTLQNVRKERLKRQLQLESLRQTNPTMGGVLLYEKGFRVEGTSRPVRKCRRPMGQLPTREVPSNSRLLKSEVRALERLQRKLNPKLPDGPKVKNRRLPLTSLPRTLRHTSFSSVCEITRDSLWVNLFKIQLKIHDGIALIPRHCLTVNKGLLDMSESVMMIDNCNWVGKVLDVLVQLICLDSRTVGGMTKAVGMKLSDMGIINATKTEDFSTLPPSMSAHLRKTDWEVLVLPVHLHSNNHFCLAIALKSKKEILFFDPFQPEELIHEYEDPPSPYHQELPTGAASGDESGGKIKADIIMNLLTVREWVEFVTDDGLWYENDADWPQNSPFHQEPRIPRQMDKISCGIVALTFLEVYLNRPTLVTIENGININYNQVRLRYINEIIRMNEEQSHKIPECPERRFLRVKLTFFPSLN